MLDPATITAIATNTVMALVPYFKIGTEELVKQVGVEAAKRAGDLVALVRRRLSAQPDTKQALKSFEEFPGNEAFQSLLKTTLVQVLNDDPAFAEELQPSLKHSTIQRVIATNKARIRDLEMISEGEGHQHEVNADNSTIQGVRIRSSSGPGAHAEPPPTRGKTRSRRKS
jgi:hypothetical protein